MNDLKSSIDISETVDLLQSSEFKLDVKGNKIDDISIFDNKLDQKIDNVIDSIDNNPNDNNEVDLLEFEVVGNQIPKKTEDNLIDFDNINVNSKQTNDNLIDFDNINVNSKQTNDNLIEFEDDDKNDEDLIIFDDNPSNRIRSNSDNSIPRVSFRKTKSVAFDNEDYED